jgi:tRNA threonylcarbamoyladenosine biosynthesis protein TsaE
VLTSRHDNGSVFVSHSADETRVLGSKLAALLVPGDLLCLYGEMGAGKTTFIQGLASGLGVSDLVTSPSFTLIHEHKGNVVFYHIDLYRLESRELAEAGIEEALRSNAVVAVEWAERLPRGLRSGALDIQIAFAEDGAESRRLSFRASDEHSADVIRDFGSTLDADSRT